MWQQSVAHPQVLICSAERQQFQLVVALLIKQFIIDWTPEDEDYEMYAELRNMIVGNRNDLPHLFATSDETSSMRICVQSYLTRKGMLPD